jgi:hypothetical protein
MPHGLSRWNCAESTLLVVLRDNIARVRPTQEDPGQLVWPVHQSRRENASAMRRPSLGRVGRRNAAANAAEKRAVRRMAAR